jgi:hypothetical protein
MLEVFMFGTTMFWVLVAVEIILLFMFMEYENGYGATLSVVAFALLLQWGGDTDILGFIIGNPLKVGILVAAYFALGGIWGICKWWIFCRDRVEEYDELKAEFLSSKGHAGEKVVPVELRVEWKKKLLNCSVYEGKEKVPLSEPPRVRNHKGKVLRWMTFWWVSMIWSLINDFVKRGMRAVYNRIQKFMQHISDSMFAKANIADDLEGIEEDEDKS